MDDHARALAVDAAHDGAALSAQRRAVDPTPCARSTARTRSSGMASTVPPRDDTVVAVNSAS